MMMAHLDFSMPAPLLAALVVGVLQPLYLLPITRMAALRGRNPVQFLLSAIIVVGVWALAVSQIPAFHAQSRAELLIGVMALGCGTLIYLEIWGLMSRGYTLGVLLTLYKANRPLTAPEIAQAYRGGDGLAWIMKHRVGGMVAAGVVRHDGDRLVLTPARGVIIARLYRLSVAVLGLRRTG